MNTHWYAIRIRNKYASFRHIWSASYHHKYIILTYIFFYILGRCQLDISLSDIDTYRQPPHDIFLIIYIFIFEVHANLQAFIHIRSRYQLDIRLPDIDTHWYLLYWRWRLAPYTRANTRGLESESRFSVLISVLAMTVAGRSQAVKYYI